MLLIIKYYTCRIKIKIIEVLRKRKKMKNDDNLPYIIGCSSLALALAYGIYLHNIPLITKSPQNPQLFPDKNVIEYKKITEPRLSYDDIVTEKLNNFLTSNNYMIHDVDRDGNCFFHAVSLALLRKSNIIIDHKELRRATVEYTMKNNKDGSFMVQTSRIDDDDVNRHDWENLMLTSGYYADGLAVLNMARILKEKYKIDLIIYHTNEDNFTKFYKNDTGIPHFRSYNPSTSEINDLVVYYTGDHYMSIVKHVEMIESFGREQLRHRRSNKRRKSRN